MNLSKRIASLLCLGSVLLGTASAATSASASTILKQVRTPDKPGDVYTGGYPVTDPAGDILKFTATRYDTNTTFRFDVASNKGLNVEHGFIHLDAPGTFTEVQPAHWLDLGYDHGVCDVRREVYNRNGMMVDWVKIGNCKMSYSDKAITVTVGNRTIGELGSRFLVEGGVGTQSDYFSQKAGDSWDGVDTDGTVPGLWL